MKPCIDEGVALRDIGRLVLKTEQGGLISLLEGRCEPGRMVGLILACQAMNLNREKRGLLFQADSIPACEELALAKAIGQLGVEVA
jgi:hypothetical protein